MAVLLDFESLDQAARKQFDGFVSGAGLLDKVLQGRQNPRSIAYLTSEHRSQREALQSAGFDSIVVDKNRSQRMIQLAMDAISLASRVDALVLATADPSITPLVNHLRAKGLRIEIACFRGSTLDETTRGSEFVELSRESVVIP